MPSTSDMLLISPQDRWLSPQVVLRAYGLALRHMLDDKLTCSKIVEVLTEISPDTIEKLIRSSEDILFFSKYNIVSEIAIYDEECSKRASYRPTSLSLYLVRREFARKITHELEKSYPEIKEYINNIRDGLCGLEVVKKETKTKDLSKISGKLDEFAKAALASSAILVDVFTKLFGVSAETLNRLSNLYVKWSEELDSTYRHIKPDKTKRPLWSLRLLQELAQLIQGDIGKNTELRILGSLTVLSFIRLVLMPDNYRINDKFTCSLVEFFEDIYTHCKDYKRIASLAIRLLRCEFYALIAATQFGGDIYNVNVLLRIPALAATFLLISEDVLSRLLIDLVSIYYTLICVLPISRGRIILNMYRYGERGKRFVLSLRPFMLEIQHFYYMLKLVADTDEDTSTKSQYIFTPYVVLSYFFYDKAPKKCVELTEISRYANQILKKYCISWIVLLRLFKQILKESIIISDEEKVRSIVHNCDKDDTSYYLYTTSAGRVTLDALARLCSGLITFMRSFVTKPVSLRYWHDIVGTICVI